MAVADLFLGGVCLPMCVYFLAHGQVKFDEKIPTFFTIVFYVFAQASFITAALISCERFYAIYWPLKHRQTLSTRTYGLVILTVWTLSVLGSLFTDFLVQFLSLVALNSLLCLTFVSVLVIISGLNFGVWRKFQQQPVPHHHQNRALQRRRLTKTLLLVSLIALGSWLPVSVYNLIAFLGYRICNNISVITYFYLLLQLVYQSNSVRTKNSWFQRGSQFMLFYKTRSDEQPRKCRKGWDGCTCGASDTETNIDSGSHQFKAHFWTGNCRRYKIVIYNGRATINGTKRIMDC